MEEDNNKEPLFEIGDIVVDKVVKKKWLVTFIYAPWADSDLYKGIYSSLKYRFSNDTFFYALRLKCGKKESVAPESQLEKI